jgi:purine nucleosidase
MTALPLIIDCDPGIDDAIALLTAFVAPELEILGITTVCGNQKLERVVGNALRIRELGGRGEIPVFAGCHRPLLRAPIHGQFHGATGLGAADLPEPRGAVAPVHAVDFLLATLGAAARGGRRITLCCLGPMTNLAVALRMRPEIAGGIARIVMMGGAYREAGNRTMTSEFNMLADPHAAHVVFESAIPIVALPLDATHQVMLGAAEVARFVAASGRIAPAMAGLMAHWDRNDPRRYGTRGGPLHDPLTVAWLLAPDLFTAEPARIFIEHESELCMGKTFADWYGKTGGAPNAEIVTGVDAPGVVAFFERMLSRYAGERA